MVGVVADVKNGGLEKPIGTEIFLPARQLNNASRNAYAVVRTSVDPRRLENALRQTIRDTDPAVPVSQVRTMEEVLAETQSRPRFLALVLTLFSSLALALAAFGVYGVIAYSVSQRTSEFGIRMALGAQRNDVLRLVLTEGAGLAFAGLLIGGIGAVLLSRGLEGLLFEVSRFDVATFACMVAVLGAVTLFACWVPARRATAVDPVRSLSYE